MTDQKISLREIFGSDEKARGVFYNLCADYGDTTGTDLQIVRTKAVAGAELGFGPIQSQRALYMNRQGQLLLHTDAMVAVAMMNGYAVSVEHSVPPGDFCTVRCVDGTGERGYEFTCTAEMAKKAGWTASSTWNQQPWDVLYARCAAHVMRKVCPDLFSCYLPEELGLPAPQQTERSGKSGPPLSGKKTKKKVERTNFKQQSEGEFF